MISISLVLDSCPTVCCQAARVASSGSFSPDVPAMTDSVQSFNPLWWKHKGSIREAVPTHPLIERKLGLDNLTLDIYHIYL